MRLWKRASVYVHVLQERRGLGKGEGGREKEWGRGRDNTRSGLWGKAARLHCVQSKLSLNFEKCEFLPLQNVAAGFIPGYKRYIDLVRIVFELAKKNTVSSLGEGWWVCRWKSGQNCIRHNHYSFTEFGKLHSWRYNMTFDRAWRKKPVLYPPRRMLDFRQNSQLVAPCCADRHDVRSVGVVFCPIFTSSCCYTHLSVEIAKHIGSVHVLCTTSSKSHRRYFFFGLVQLGGERIVSTFDQPSHRVQRRVFVLRARHLPQHYVVFCVFHTLFARARCSALALLFRRIDIVLREENNNRYIYWIHIHT